MNLIRSFFWPTKHNNFRAYLLRPWIVGSICFTFISLHAIWIGHSLYQSKVKGSQTDLSTSQIISLTNLERSKAGATPLQPNELLSLAAEKKAESMIQVGVFEHYYETESELINPWTFILDSGYDYFYAGENLGKDFTSATKLVQAWMDSPTHRENLLNPNYQEIGVAVVEGPYLDKTNTTLIVQLFATSADAIVTELSSPPERPGQINVTPLLESDKSWAQQLIQQYPGLLFVATIIVTVLIGMTLLVDIEFAKKKSRDKELSIELWRH